MPNCIARPLGAQALALNNDMIAEQMKRRSLLQAVATAPLAAQQPAAPPEWNQSHDIKNLFVVDGSSFVTGGSQNPTMTILALSMRASEYLADQMKSGSL